MTTKERVHKAITDCVDGWGQNIVVSINQNLTTGIFNVYVDKERQSCCNYENGDNGTVMISGIVYPFKVIFN